MLNIDVMVPDVMVSDVLSVLVVSQCGIVYPKKVHANVFVSPPWLLGQQGKAPPENLWKMHAEVSNNFTCIKYVPAIFDDKSKVNNLKRLYDIITATCTCRKAFSTLHVTLP